MWVVFMCDSVRGGAMNASSVRVVQGKDGTPIIVRDEEPFLIDRWRDVETGNEYINEYRLIFSFREDSLFFDPIGDRRRSCYVCGSDALHECIRCNKDVCDQHAVFAETEYEEPLTYCHECFDKVVEK
jgi:hypothetical protein